MSNQAHGEDDELITIREAAVILQRTPQHVYVYVRNGLLTPRGYRPAVGQGRPITFLSATEVEQLRQKKARAKGPMTATEIRQLIMTHVEFTLEGCWHWAGSIAASGRVPIVIIRTAEGWKHLNVWRWLWQEHHGYTLPRLFVQPCTHDAWCVHPEHRHPKYELSLIQYAVKSLQHGEPVAAVSKQYGLPASLLNRLLTPIERQAVQYDRNDRAFWANVEMTEEHWILLHRHNATHQGMTMQAKHKAWSLAGRALKPGHILRTICGVKSCIRPDCQREIKAPGMRVSVKRRTAATAQRHAQMVELVTQYQWTRKRVAALFECSVAMVDAALRKARDREEA